MITHQSAGVEEAVLGDETHSIRETLRRKFSARLNVPPWVLLVAVFIGLGWLRAAVEKIIDPSWWNGDVLDSFFTVHADLALPWYQRLIDTVIEPNALLIAVTVVVAQLFAGIALVTGEKLLAGLAIGLFLNVNFVAAGAVNPSAFYLVSQIALLLWILHDRGSVEKRSLRLLATVSSALVLLNLPFIATLDPATVIEDPAMMLVTLGLLTAIVSRIGVRSPEEEADGAAAA